jgi:hypothetical protein
VVARLGPPSVCPCCVSPSCPGRLFVFNTYYRFNPRWLVVAEPANADLEAPYPSRQAPLRTLSTPGSAARPISVASP